MVKESACNVGDLGSMIPELGRSPGGGHGNPFQYSCLENPHEQRSLAGDSPWGHKESDTAEQPSTAPITDTWGDSVLESRDTALLTEVPIVKAIVFPIVIYRSDSWTVKKAEHWRIDGTGADSWESLGQ